MTDWLTLFIFALATWRISSLLVIEDGPFYVFVRIRVLSGIEYYPVSKGGLKYRVPRKFFAQLLSCVWCCSVYIGVFLAALYFFSPVIAFWLALPFTLSAGAILINLLVEKLKS